MFRLFKKKKPVEETSSDSSTNDQANGQEQQHSNQSIDSLIETNTDLELNAEAINSDSNISDSSNQQDTVTLEQVADNKVPEQQHVTEEIKEVNETLSEGAATKIVNEPQQIPQEKPKKQGLFDRLKSGLAKTGSTLTEGMGALVLGKKKIDDDVLEELETRLLMSDVGIEATQRIIKDLTKRVSRNELNDYDALIEALYEAMVKILRPVAKPLDVDDIEGPAVILLVGINGAGKTTTIGKLAKQLQGEGKSVMLAAGDTFRAAAVEQLKVWGERNDIPVVAQGTGADSASVIYDAMASAKAKNIDVLLADTAGRLHTQTNLMEELKKVKRVMQKIDINAPHEIMLIVDASIGQNALSQVTEFDAALGVTGITVTKLDGTAKGGILFAMAEKAGISVRFIGVGESIDDLQEFDAYEFVGALLAEDE